MRETTATNKSSPLPQLTLLTALLIATLTLVVSCGQGSSSLSGDAPRFSLETSTGQQVTLEQLLDGNDVLVLVFYRGVF
jgi:hypothetical protein